MQYLTNETGGNIHDNGTIEITSNSINGSSYHPKNLVDYTSESTYYQASNTSNSTINFDFKERSIQLKSYAIKSYNASANNYYHLRNWVIEVSNNQANWIEVDSHSNDSTLNKQSYAAIFNVQRPRNEFYRYIRLRQTGYTWYSSSNCYYMTFPLIEFFGKLKHLRLQKGNLRFNAQKGKEFEGIMRYLTNKTGGNIHDNGTIIISSNSIYNGHHPKNLVDYNSESSFYHADNYSGNTVNFDFKEKKVRLTSYAIKSYNASANNYYHLRNWVIEVSNDQSNWIEVDSHSNDSTLNKQSYAAIFNVKRPRNEFYRYIRLRQTGYSWCGNYYYMIFPLIEFFGDLKLHNTLSYPREFKAKTGQEFNGIMRYLTNQTGGNIHDNGTIEISSNSINSGHPKNLVDYNSESTYYQSGNSSGATINFDFKNRCIQLSSYAIKSYNSGPNATYHLRNWVIEVSNDQSKWIEVDSRSNDPTLNKQSYAAIFNLKRPRNEFYRYIRLRQTGYTWYSGGNYYYMTFPLIEFFGKIKDSF